MQPDVTSSSALDSSKQPETQAPQKRPLPGLVTLFAVQLYVCIIGCILVAIAGIIFSGYASELLFFTLGATLIGIWLITLLVKIHGRSPQAPQSCALFLLICLVLGILATISMCIPLLNYFDATFFAFFIVYVIQLVFTYAYREYFKRSQAVQECFNSLPTCNKPALPISIGLLQAFCAIHVIQYVLAPLPLFMNQGHSSYSSYNFYELITPWAAGIYWLAVIPALLLFLALNKRTTEKQYVHILIGGCLITHQVLFHGLGMLSKQGGAIDFSLPLNCFLSTWVLALLWWGLCQEKAAKNWFACSAASSLAKNNWVIAIEQALAEKRLPILLLGILYFCLFRALTMLRFNLFNILEKGGNLLTPEIALPAAAAVVICISVYAICTQNSQTPYLVLLAIGFLLAGIGTRMFFTPLPTMLRSLGFYTGDLFILGCTIVYVLRSPYLHWLYGQPLLAGEPVQSRPFPVNLLLCYLCFCAVQALGYLGESLYKGWANTNEVYYYDDFITNMISAEVVWGILPIICIWAILQSRPSIKGITISLVAWLAGISLYTFIFLAEQNSSSTLWTWVRELAKYKEAGAIIAAALWYLPSSTEVKRWLAVPNNS